MICPSINKPFILKRSSPGCSNCGQQVATLGHLGQDAAGDTAVDITQWNLERDRSSLACGLCVCGGTSYFVRLTPYYLGPWIFSRDLHRYAYQY